MQNPTKLFATLAGKSNSFAVSGARWESKYYIGDGTKLYTISYDEDTKKATVATSTAKEDLTGKQLTISPLGTVCAASGVSFFRYADHAYMVDPTHNANQFQLFDVTNGLDNAKVASDLYPATVPTDAPNIHTLSWVDGYTIHIMTLADGYGMQHYQTLSAAVANIYAGEVDYDGKNFIFRLNEDATDVTISIEKNNEIVATQSVGALKKGPNKVANLWIEKWEGDRVTIRGWSDDLKTLVSRTKTGGSTAAQIIEARLKGSPAVDPSSVKIESMNDVGKDAALKQIVVVVKFGKGEER